MAIGDVIAQARQERGLTQGQLAQRLFVTRQAVSRWENGETTPNIDMVKLLAITLEVPVTRLLEVPEHPCCQSCGMPLTTPDEIGHNHDGSPADYCVHCFADGEFRYDATMDEVIEGCAPFMAQHTGISLDEAVSFMGILLPTLKRWKDNEDGKPL